MLVRLLDRMLLLVNRSRCLVLSRRLLRLLRSVRRSIVTAIAVMHRRMLYGLSRRVLNGLYRRMLNRLVELLRLLLLLLRVRWLVVVVGGRLGWWYLLGNGRYRRRSWCRLLVLMNRLLGGLMVLLRLLLLICHMRVLTTLLIAPLLLLLLNLLLMMAIIYMLLLLLLRRRLLLLLLLILELQLPLPFLPLPLHLQLLLLLLRLLLQLLLPAVPLAGSDLLRRKLHRRLAGVQIRIDVPLRVAADAVRVVRFLQTERHVPPLVVGAGLAGEPDGQAGGGRVRIVDLFLLGRRLLLDAQRVAGQVGVVVHVVQRGRYHVRRVVEIALDQAVVLHR